jgi:hypothetical protein
MKKCHYMLLVLVATAVAATAQIKTPAPSPLAKVSQEVGLGKVELDYSRPSAKGRTVFGDLVAYGEMWRTGANNSSKITFSEDVVFGGIAVPKGTYAVYTVPGRSDWDVLLYKNTSFWGIPGGEFKESDVAARVKVAARKTGAPVETLTMDVTNISNKSADFQLSWENTLISVPMVFDTDSKVMADIKTQMEGPNAGTYYQSARYYYEEGKDMNTALGWINSAIEKGGEKFWYLRLKANILGELKRYPEAIATAERSTEIARKEGNTDYPRMNDKSISEWKKMK